MTVYCDSVSGSNTSPYETLAKAATTYLVAVDQLVAGEDMLVTSNHTEDPGINIVYTFPGTAAAPNRVISIARADESYEKASTIQVDNTSIVRDIELHGHAKLYGASLASGDDILVNIGGDEILFYDSLLTLQGVNSKIIFGNSGHRVLLTLRKTNINYSAGGAGGGFAEPSAGAFEWHGGTLSIGGAQPTSLFESSARSATYNIRGVNISALTNPIVDISGAGVTFFDINGCLLDPSVTFTTGTIVNSASKYLMSGCDDTIGNHLYRLEYVDFYGTTIDIDTIHVTTDGASDGTTLIAHKMVTTANATEFSEPHIGPPIPLWIDSTAEQTFTVKLIWDSASDIQDDECWLELEYLDASADTQSAFKNDGLANVLASPVDQANNTETWTGTSGFSNENKIDLTVTATPGRVGPAIARVHLAKPSTTVYIDPKVVAVAT